MTDALLRQTNDGGEITVDNGLVLMSDGLETAAYLSLFGGNDDDAGDDASARRQWWGNLDETEAAARYRSETQYLLSSGLPAVPSNLRRFEQAAGRDLAWLVETGTARSVTVAVSIPALNRVHFDVQVITRTGVAVHLAFG